MEKTLKNPFNSYDQEEMTGFVSLNKQLNTKYREVAGQTYETTEQETFFQNKVEIASQNIATACDRDSTCSKNMI